MPDAHPKARLPEGTPLAAARPSPETIELLTLRRSTKWLMIEGPGPTEAQLDDLLAIASRVPDHGKLAPWRFITVTGEAVKRLGEAAAETLRAHNATCPPDRLELERARFAKTPAVVIVVSRVDERHKIPVWEQRLSAGAVCMTLLIAANAMGFAGSWITDWFTYDSDMKARLGVKPGERIAGIIGLGTAGQVEERKRPDLTALITRWTD